MGTKQMRVSEDLYARVKSENREEETLAETLDRLVSSSQAVSPRPQGANGVSE